MAKQEVDRMKFERCAKIGDIMPRVFTPLL